MTTIIYIKNKKCAPELRNKLSNHEYECDSDVFVVEGDVELDRSDDYEVVSRHSLNTLINKKIRHRNLNPVTFNYDWVKNEQFFVLHRSILETYTVHKKDVENCSTLDNINNFVTTHCGNIFGFIRDKEVRFMVGDELQAYYDLHFDSTILRCTFSSDDVYLVVETVEEVVVYEFRKCREILRNTNTQKHYGIFVDENVSYFYYNNGVVELETGRKKGEINGINFNEGVTFRTNGTKYAAFINNRIVTADRSKNYLNVSEVDFHFSRSRMYAVIRKRINNIDQYSIDCFTGTEIVSVTPAITGSLVSTEFADNGFVITTSNNSVLFYERVKFSYVLVKQINLLGKSIAQIHPHFRFYQIYDKMNETVEMYHRGDLIRKYSQKGATGMCWSQSGLYLCVYSCNVNQSGGMVQIFNVDGKLIYKSLLPGLTRFIWREYEPISRENEADAMKEFQDIGESESEDYDNENVEKMRKEWIGYLRECLARN